MKNTETVHNFRFLTVQQVAENLQVEAKSVRRWLTVGKLIGYKLPGGDWRIKPEDARAVTVKVRDLVPSDEQVPKEAIRRGRS